MSRGATVVVKCKRCREPFSARVADRKRGWGKFCSKSCKAIKQTQKTGISGPPRERYSDEREQDYQWHLLAMQATEEGWDSHKRY